MAYEIGTATSAKNLLDKIRVVAVAQGWTVHADVAETASVHWLSISKGTSFFNLRSNTTSGGSLVGEIIELAIATGFDSLSGFLAQPNTSYVDNQQNAGCGNLIGPFTSYRIFSGATYIHLVVEVEPAVFNYLAIGTLAKYGTYTGGEYIAGSVWSNGTFNINDPAGPHSYLFDNASQHFSNINGHTVRAEVDGRRYSSNNSASFSSGISVTGLIRQVTNLYYLHQNEVPNKQEFLRSPNLFNQITPLLSSPLYIERGSELLSPIGEVPDFRVLNITNYNPADEITIGADTWVTFPARQKSYDSIGNSANQTPNSWVYGYAFKKVL